MAFMRHTPTHKPDFHQTITWIGAFMVTQSPTMELSRKIVSLCEHKDIKGNRKLTKWLQKNDLMRSTIKCRICKRNMKLRKTLSKDGYKW